MKSATLWSGSPGSTGPRPTRSSGFVRRTHARRLRLEQAARSSSTPIRGRRRTYPNYGLARRLELIGRIIKAGFGTRIYYTSLDGFDTHANQLGAHAALLNELSDSIAAFHKDLSDAGQADRVAVLTFSEFGRRVAENASNGTDHGAAAPAVRRRAGRQAGTRRDAPELDDLDDGDLKHHTDFRRVYASLLETWLGCPSAPVIGEGFRPLDLCSGGRQDGLRRQGLRPSDTVFTGSERPNPAVSLPPLVPTLKRGRDRFLRPPLRGRVRLSRFEPKAGPG